MEVLFLIAFIGGFFPPLIQQKKLGAMAVPAVVFFLLMLMSFFGGFTMLNRAFTLFILPSIFFEYNKPGVFKKNIIVFIAGLFLSMVSCYYFRGQTIFDSFWACLSFSLFGILFYFFIRPFRLSIAQMERVLVILIVLFSIAYVFQYLVYPKLVFVDEQQRTYEGDIRIRLMGQGLASLGYFFSLNKLLLHKKKRMLNGIILLVSLLVIVLMGFRTMLLGVVVMTVIVVIKIMGFSYRLLGMAIFLSVSSVFIINIPVVSEKLDAMSQRQKTDNFSNNDYIRFAQLQYYTNNHFKSEIEYFFGSGLPLTEKANTSAYGRYMNGLVDRGLNWVDWGLLSISWVIGIISALAIIVYSIKAFLIKVNKPFIYLGTWFLYLVFISFTTMEIFRPGNLALEAFCFVILEQLSRSEEPQSKTRN